jgi:general secretion pathway protein K
LVSLWVLTLLSLVVLGAAHGLGIETRLASYQWQETRLLAGARLALLSVADSLRASAPAAYDALNQPWSRSPEFFKDRAVEGGSFTLERREGDDVFYGCGDESGKIDLNSAPPDVLDALFAAAPGASAALQDWRDADDAPRPDGGEKDDYRGPSPRNASLRTLDELLLVKGVTPEVFRQVAPLVTVHGGSKVNVNTAAPGVFAALGLDPVLVEKITAYRRGDDGRAGTDDDGVFADLTDMARRLDLTPEENASLNKALQRNLLGVRSLAWRLPLRIVLDDGAARNFHVVVAARSWPPRVLEWREASW